MKIEIKCKGAKTLDHKKMVPFQGELKDLSDQDYEKLKKNILELGFSEPISVWLKSGKHYLLNGHQRHRAIIKMVKEGYKCPPLPVNLIEAKDIKQAKKKVLSLTSQFGEMTKSGLEQFMIDADISFEEIKESFRFPEISFDDFETPVNNLGQCDEDEVPEQVPAVSVLGDLYELGEHRLLCGDSTSIDAVEKLMNNEKADMVFTSPPYNGNTRFNPGKGGSGFGGGKNLGPLYENDQDNKSSEEYVEFTQSVLNNCFAVLNGFLFWNVNYNSNSRAEFIKQIVPYLDQLVETICWKKTALPVPHGLTRTWEPIFVFSSFDKAKRIGHANQTEFNFWDISNSGALEKSHRAAYPVALPEKGIALCDPKNVLDPFGGSGSTLIACEKTNRKCFMMELDPHYIDIIVSRYVKYTGNSSVKRNGKNIKWKT